MTTKASNNENESSIPQALSKQMLQLVTPPDGHSNKKRIPKETAQAVSDILRMLVLEARSRATLQVSEKL